MRAFSQELLYNVTGQTLVFDAPEGRPSSVTSVAVYRASDDDTATAESATTGSASVESNPATTFDAASGAGQADPTKCNLTATTGITRGRVYLATNAVGDKEWVPVTAFSSGSHAFSRVPLQNAYAASDAFESTRMSIAVDSTWIADVDNISSEESTAPGYRVVWVYVASGVTYRHQSFVDVVRYSAQHQVTGVDVDARFPGWIEQLPTDYRREQGQSLVDEAFRAVKMDMLADGKATRWLRNADVVNELTAYRARMMLSENGVIVGSGTLDGASMAAEAYRQRYQQLVQQPHVVTSVSPGGASLGEGKPSRFWRR